MPEKIAILAGNPKVEIIDGEINIDPQLPAFEAAMKVVRSCREQISKIAIAFDHRGLFQPQFCPAFNRKTKKHLKLKEVDRRIMGKYYTIAADNGVRTDEISVISEDLLRAKIKQKTTDPRLYAQSPCDGECTLGTKVNCRGITASIIDYLASHGDKVITYWVFDPERVKPATITDGTELSFSVLGVKVPVEQNIIVVPPVGRAYVMTTDFSLDGQGVKVEMREKRALTEK